MAIVSRFEADFTSFQAAVDAATAKLKSLDAGSANVAAGLTKMANSFSGSKIIADATYMTKAIAEAGGASTLTAREMARVNSTVDEAIAKYKALGQTAPQSMIDLANATKQVVSPMDMFVQRLDKAKEGLIAFGSGAKTIGIGLTAGITAPLAAIGLAAFKAATDFESSFAGVRKTVDVSEPELGRLAGAFRKLATEIPVSVNELNRVAEAGGQLGVKSKDIETFTRTMADMGVATNLSSDQAATALAQIANIINNEAGPQYDRLGSTIVALGNKSAATESDIVEFGLRLAGAGKVAGLTEPEILSIGTALASVGINAEAGGTAFSKVMIEISSAAASGGDEIDKFAKVAGMSAAAFKQSFESDAAGAIVSFVEGLGRIDKEGGNLFKTIEDLGMSEVRLRDALLRAAGAGDLMRDTLVTGKQAWIDNNALTIEAEKRYATVASQLTMLWNKVNDVAITIGEALVPTLLQMVKAGEPVIKWLGEAAQWFKELPEGVRTAAVGFAALAAAVGPAVFILGSLAGAVANLIPLYIAATTATVANSAALGVLATAWGLLTTPITVNTVLMGANTAGMAAGSAMVATLTGSLGLLKTAMLALPWAAAAAGIGALTVAYVKWRESAELARLSTETQGAKQDSINLAIQRGAAATIQYADAIKFNDEWFKKLQGTQAGHVAEQQRIAGSTKDLTDLTGKWSAQIKSAEKEISQLSSSVKAELTQALKSGAFEMKDLQKASGLSEVAMKLFADQVKKAGTETRGHAKELNEVAKAHEQVRLASVPLTAAQQAQLTSLLKLNAATGENVISTKTMAKEIGASEVQVKVFEASVKLAGATLDKNTLAARQNEAGLFGLHTTVGKLNTTEQEFLKLSMEVYDSLLKVEKAAWVAAFGFNGMADGLENLGRKSTELDEVKKHLDNAEQSTKALSGVLHTLSGDFAQMAQIAGDSFSEIARNIGMAIKTVEMATRAIDELTKMAKVGFSSASAAALIFTGAIAGFGVLLSKSRKEAALMQSSMDELTASVLDFATAEQIATTAAGGASLAELVLTDAYKLTGRSIGELVTDMQALMQARIDGPEAMEAAVKKLQQAFLEINTALNLAAMIKGFEDASGALHLTADQSKIVAQNFALLFKIVEQGGPNGAKAIEAMDTSLIEFANSAVSAGGLVSQFFLDMVRKAKAAGIELAGVNDFIVGQLASAAKGLNALFIGLQKSSAASAVRVVSDAEKVILANIARLQAALKGASGDYEESLHRQIRVLHDELALLQTDLVTSFLVTQAQGAGLAAALVANFAEMVQSGSTFKDALDALQPSIDALGQMLKDSGVEGGAAFQTLIDISTLASNAITGPLLDAINGANVALKGLHNSGILNQEMFGALALTAVQAFDKIIKQGVSGNAALMLMAPTLQTIWQLQKDFSYEVDQATQALLDEAIAAGLVGEAHKPVAQQMLDATKRIATAVEALAQVFGVVLPAAAAVAASSINTQLSKIKTPVIAPPWATWGAPPAIPAPGTPAPPPGARMASLGLSSRGVVLPFMPRISAPVLTATLASSAGASAGGADATDVAALQNEVRGLRTDLRNMQRDQLRATTAAFKAAVALNPRRVA